MNNTEPRDSSSQRCWYECLWHLVSGFNPMPPRITEESNRPRVSDRTLVANLATTLLVRFKKTKGVVTITSMKTLGTGIRCLAAGARGPTTINITGTRCTQGWGLDARKHPRPPCGRGKMSLDIPFYRTFVSGRRGFGYAPFIKTQSAPGGPVTTCDTRPRRPSATVERRRPGTLQYGFLLYRITARANLRSKIHPTQLYPSQAAFDQVYR